MARVAFLPLKESSPQIRIVTLLLPRKGYFLPCVQLGVQGQATATTSSSVHHPNPKLGHIVTERKSSERGRSFQQLTTLKQPVTNLQTDLFVQLSCAVKTARSNATLFSE